MDQWIWTILLLIIAYVVYHAVCMNTRFRKYGIPQPLEIPFFGFLGSGFLYKYHISVILQQAYNMGAKYIGCHMFTSPFVIVCDTDLIKSVLVKDFDNFAYHRTFVDDSIDPLFGKNLFFVNGKKWREIRSLLSPSFTSSKMRAMYVLMSRCAEDFVDIFLELYSDKDATDMKDVFTRYANDVIATCAFGLEVNSLRDPENEFYTTGRRTTNFASGGTRMRLLLLRAFPNLAKKMGVRIVSKKDTDFFVNAIESTIRARDEKGITRPDMLQLMMDARGKTTENVNFDTLEMTAQAFVFFLGGFETTSGQMCLMAHELAVNPDIQQKLQAEIDAAMEESNGQLTYEVVNNLNYLDAVFSETLRMHPPLPMVSRVCSQDFELPPAVPGAKPYIVKADMEVVIPVSGIHKNPDIYENPDRFDPDRFIDKKAVNADVTNLGFGLGPRMCIGNRFAVLETKVMFAHLLSKCSLVPCEKTLVPLEYDPKNFSPFAKGGFWLQVKSRK